MLIAGRGVKPAKPWCDGKVEKSTATQPFSGEFRAF
jgi:hypothetical protein